ncbi:urease accessory UreF family protein [Marinobacterium sp. xm-a-152]|uniref:urease accessory protein UreF n=1 Tax=Marinobacterium sp. xm-a-152 TaxID=2497733 RepID=UPI0015690F90|nr:Urease accessory protein UreF [Marinobacterium sp. xm-a-152]
MLSDLRLFQLISPSLPVGAFTYSQGLELAVEAGWVDSQERFEAWLTGQLNHSLTTLELPVLDRMLNALDEADAQAFNQLTKELIAWRETKELRLEEKQRGAALARLLPQLDVNLEGLLLEACQRTQLAGIAIAAHQWQIPRDKLFAGYLWSWLENAVMAGVKLIPLGQTQGQQTLQRMASSIEQSVEHSKRVLNPSSVTPALAIASSRHETQYTRLFRS